MISDYFIFDSESMSKKRLFSVHMKVQFLLSWCLDRGVSELSPLARSIHLEHGKYMYNYTCTFHHY